MTENGLPEQSAARSSRRTRRQLLTGGAAAVGVLAAQALARGTPALADNGQSLNLGFQNTATSMTSITDSGGDTAFQAISAAGGPALAGSAIDGTGVIGDSFNGTGVFGLTDSSAANASAVYGQYNGQFPGPYSSGVRGEHQGTGDNGIGVYGSHAGSGWGVYGTSANSTGVKGLSAGGSGVEGSGAIGVYGISESRSGVGVLAQNPNDSGVALQVTGVTKFSRSGVATVLAGRSQVTQQLPLGPASFVLATIQDNVTDLYVRGVKITSGTNGSFTIHLSTAVKSDTKVAWLAMN